MEFRSARRFGEQLEQQEPSSGQVGLMMIISCFPCFSLCFSHFLACFFSSRNVPNTAQNGHQNGPKIVRKWSQIRPKMISKSSQNGFKTGPQERLPCRPPFSLYFGASWGAPGTILDALGHIDGPSWGQEGPRWSQVGAKMGRGEPRKGQHEAKMWPDGAQGRQDGTKIV